MTFDELWNARLQYYKGFDYAVSQSMWNLAQEHMLEESAQFDNWWNYHSSKKSIKTLEQAARWAWYVQQCEIENMEQDFRTIAQSLNIPTSDMNIRDLRKAILESLQK